jgi:hypothetical protein
MVVVGTPSGPMLTTVLGAGDDGIGPGTATPLTSTGLVPGTVLPGTAGWPATGTVPLPWLAGWLASEAEVPANSAMPANVVASTSPLAASTM